MKIQCAKKTYTTHQASLLLSQTPLHLLRYTDRSHCCDVTILAALSWCQLFGSVGRFHWERSKPRVEWDYPLLYKEVSHDCLPRQSHLPKIPPLLQDLKWNHGNKTPHTSLDKFRIKNIIFWKNSCLWFRFFLTLEHLSNSKSAITCIHHFIRYCIFVYIEDFYVL